MHESPSAGGPQWSPLVTPERIRSVFLFTDGQATAGLKDKEPLLALTSMMLQNPISPTIYCFGFGKDFDSDCLESIAQAGQGQSCFIEDAESIPGALASALGGLMTMSAQNVELSFTPKVGNAAMGSAPCRCAVISTCTHMRMIHCYTLR